MSENDESKINSTKANGNMQVEKSDNQEKPDFQLRSFAATLIKTLPVILLASLFAFIFTRSDLVVKLEKLTHQIRMQLNQAEDDSPVVIVEITQDSFEQDFKGQTRPLDPEILHRLISAVAKGQPCVIAVDIDTTFSQFKDFNIDRNWKPYTIWARTALIKKQGDDEKPLALDVLGSQDLELNTNSGLAYVIKDADDLTVRRYVRMIETFEGKMPSFAWTIYKKGEERQCSGINFPLLDEKEPPLFINYSRGPEEIKRTKVFASDILQSAESDDLANSELLKNKIVLIGGSYLGEDRHQTPLGEMLGVEIAANIIETELSGSGVKPLNWITNSLIAFFDGIILLGIFVFAETRKIPFYKAILISLASIIFLSFLCSLLLYHSFSYWMYFAPVMFGILIAEIYDKTKDYLKGDYKSKLNETISAITNKLKAKPESDLTEE